MLGSHVVPSVPLVTPDFTYGKRLYDE